MGGNNRRIWMVYCACQFILMRKYNFFGGTFRFNRVHSRRGLGGRPHICPSDAKFPPPCLWFLVELPDTRKCTLPTKNLKIELCVLLKLSSQQTNCTVCELWQFSKNQKWKQSSDGMVRMIEPLSSMLPPSNYSTRYLKKSWDQWFLWSFRNCYLKFSPVLIFKEYAGCTRSQAIPCPHLSLKYTWILGNGKEHVFNTLAENLLWLFFFTWRPKRDATLKFLTACWILN